MEKEYVRCFPSIYQACFPDRLIEKRFSDKYKYINRSNSYQTHIYHLPFEKLTYADHMSSTTGSFSFVKEL